MRSRIITFLAVVAAVVIIVGLNRKMRAEAQRPQEAGEKLKKWGDTQELATKNAGKKATLTFAADGEPIGDVVIEFYPEDAPNTVENFIQLAQDGFYDGLTFHRVIKGFMIQGGDPDGTGTGGPGWRIPAEFNSRHHAPGIVAMARSQSPDSAGSQFYICLGAPSHLDGQYTIFGKVISGQEYVNQFGDVPTDARDRPTKKLTMQKVVIHD